MESPNLSRNSVTMRGMVAVEPINSGLPGKCAMQVLADLDGPPPIAYAPPQFGAAEMASVTARERSMPANRR